MSFDVLDFALASPTQTAPRNLLLVEDTEPDARLVRETLADAPGPRFQIEHVRTLEEASRSLALRAFDVVLLDLSLPDSRGLGTVEKLRGVSRDVPIVVLTGLRDETSGLKAVEMGAQDYLVKGAYDERLLPRALLYAIARAGYERLQRTALEQQRELARLREMDEWKTRFINVAAHELLTPLTPMKLQLDLLRQGGDLHESLQVIDRNFRRLQRITSDILDGARLQAGRLTILPQTLDLAAVVREAVESFRAPAIAAGLALTLRAPEPLRVTADAQRIGQVLDNLLANAVKFTPAGGEVAIEAIRRDREAVVSVRDTGIGIPPEKVGGLFQPFTQAHDPAKVTRTGSGLGLYISKGIVEKHGGRIWCGPGGPGKGATFTFTIPLAP